MLFQDIFVTAAETPFDSGKEWEMQKNRTKYEHNQVKCLHCAWPAEYFGSRGESASQQPTKGAGVEPIESYSFDPSFLRFLYVKVWKLCCCLTGRVFAGQVFLVYQLFADHVRRVTDTAIKEEVLRLIENLEEKRSSVEQKIIRCNSANNHKFFCPAGGHIHI